MFSRPVSSGMKAGADFEQAGDAAAQGDAPLGRLGDAGQDLEQRALAGAVAADDAEDLALAHLEVDILERPEFLDRVALHDLPAAQEIAGLAAEIPQLLANDIAQCGVTGLPFALPAVADQIALRQIFDRDDRS